MFDMLFVCSILNCIAKYVMSIGRHCCCKIIKGLLTLLYDDKNVYNGRNGAAYNEFQIMSLQK